MSGNQTKTIFTKTVTVPYSSDGSKTCSFSTSCGINVTLSGVYYSAVTASGGGTFNTIARSSGIYSVTSSVAINGTNAATVTTYSGSTKICSSVSKSFTVTVPATVIHSVTSVTLAEAVSGLTEQFDGYVHNKSKLPVSVSAAGIYSSTIKSYKTTIDGITYTAASFTSGILMNIGSRTITVTVTDSRGRAASATMTITVIDMLHKKLCLSADSEAFRTDLKTMKVHI